MLQQEIIKRERARIREQAQEKEERRKGWSFLHPFSPTKRRRLAAPVPPYSCPSFHVFLARSCGRGQQAIEEGIGERRVDRDCDAFEAGCGL